jgi:predicted TIM-barrel fold metal-dependent hydrolase
MTATELLVGATISADSHVTEPPDTYSARIAAEYRDRAPQIRQIPGLGVSMVIDPDADGQMFVPYAMVAAAGRPAEEIGLDTNREWDWLHPGGHDNDARLREQDTDGVMSEIIYPSTGMLLCNHRDRAYMRACMDAYNRWLAEWCAIAPNRLVGIGQTAMRSPDEAIQDLHAIRALGLRGVMLPGFPVVDDYDSPVYDDFWRACIDLDLPVSFHILTGGDGLFGKPRGPRLNSFLSIIRGNQDIIGMLVFGAVFERHPELKVVCVEADAGWAAHFMYRSDHAYDRHRNWLPAGAITKRPSEYIWQNVYLTFQDDWVAFRNLDIVNPERLMWANDHPHSDSTWPNSQALLHEHTHDLTEHQRHRILRANCAELYGIDLDGAR